MKNIFIPNIDTEEYLESFLISAVFSVLIIRFYLNLTGYPQIGVGVFHIAHILWGGFLMLSAIVLFSSFINRSVYRVAAIVGGIGFGTFIDEIGKFITRDNNYFFQPSIAIIYFIFVLIYFAFRYLDKERRLRGHEYLINALEITKQLILEPNNIDKAKIERLLRRSADPIALQLMHLVNSVEIDKRVGSGYLEKLEEKIENFYLKIIKDKRFNNIVIIFFIIYTIVSLWRAYWLVGLYLIVDGVDWSFVDFALMVSTLISAVFVIFGVLRILKSKRQGYIFLRFATLTTIFLTQFFAFYRDQIGAIFGLFINIAVLAVLQYMIKHELRKD